MSEARRRIPWLPYAVMAILASAEPLTHLWILYGAPAGAVPTGVHTGDSSHHLVAMESFANGFRSPFATCQAEDGLGSFRYFAVPIFMLYGLVGEFGRILGVPPFLFLGLANGAGGFLLLWSVYRFLGRIAPGEARLAFYLYALGGGVGGAAFLAARAAGAIEEPGFELWFYRFAQYDLIEGQHLAPLLLMPRLYYTLPLALGFAALTALVETDRCRCPGHLVFTGFLLFLTACLNLRLGPLFWGLGLLYLLAGSRNGGRYRLQLAAATAAPVLAGSALFVALMRQHPSYQGNVAEVTRTCALLLPLLYATLFHTPAIAAGILRGFGGLAPPLRRVSLFLLAWLAAYGTLYMGHQAWYGNWWRGGDMGAAILASDRAVLLALPLYLIALFRKPRGGRAKVPHLHWVLLWFLGVLAVSLLAAGGGWFLQFSPQRCMVLLGVPLALLSAAGIQALGPRRGRIACALIIGGGLLSNGVGALWFQGPLGRSPGEGAFAYLHYEYMTEVDGALLEKLPAGTIAVPPWSPIAFGEILVHHGDYRVLGGPGAMNLGDQPLGPLQRDVNRFFEAGASDGERRDFAIRWCVDYVYCPDTCPVDEGVMDQLRATPWLIETAHGGRGAIFRVILGR